jgi:LysR family glycine cleavage system transcriptional activator
MTRFQNSRASGNQLLVFEAAAKHLSFTRAANELNVTQPAVSRMVARFEEHIGLNLFKRSPVGISLTDDGRILYEAVARGLDSIGQVLEQLQRNKESSNRVTLSVSSAFASHWLIPRFGSFQIDHPEISLQFQLTGGEPSGQLHDADLGIRLIKPDDGVEYEAELVPENIIAVCSPSYATEFGTLDDPGKDGEVTLISFAHARISWGIFFKETGIAEPGQFNEITFTDYAVVVQSALAGQGIALGWSHIVDHAMQNGLLQLASKACFDSNSWYKLYARETSKSRTEVRLVAEWLIQGLKN